MTWANKTAFFLLCVSLIVATLAYGAVHQPVIALFYIAMAAVAVLWAVDCLLTGNIRYSRTSLQLPIILAAAYGVFQVIPFGSVAETAGLEAIPRTISVFPFATIQSALHFIALLIFFAGMLVSLDRAARIRKVAGLVTIFGFGFAFFAILQSVLSPDKIYGIYETRFGSPFGSFVNRHNFAAFMEMSMAVPLGLLFTGAVAKEKRLLYVTAVALMGVALLLSGSRGGLVAFFAQLVFLVLVTVGSRNRRNLALKFALVAVLFAAIVGGSFFVGGETSLSRIAETAASKDVTTDRAHIWSVSLKVIFANLPFGAGLGAFGVAYTPFDTNSGLERVEQAHNDYLQVAADAGLPGLLIGAAFLFFLYRTGRTSIRVENTYRRGIAVGAFAGIFAVLVHSIFDFVLHTTAISLLFLTITALMVASGSSYEDDTEGEIRPHRKRPREGKARVSPFKR